MNSLQRGILDLIRAALTKESITLPTDFDWVAACDLGAAHQILPLLYYGAHNAGLSLPEELSKKLEGAIFQGIFRDQNQLYELERLRSCFVEHGIEFMPVKGVLLKALYPQTDMRPMSDADILIKTAQYEAIAPLMESLGYTAELESDHELAWLKPGALYVELHKHLIPSYHKDYYAYFGDGWKLACPTDTSEYRMKDEDHFIYLFTHYAKHYRSAGIGIRHLVDLYVYLQAKPDLNWAYMERELEALQLLTFFRHSLSTIDVWFKGAEVTPVTEVITNRIFGSGAFGTAQNDLMWNAVKAAKTVDTDQVKRQKWVQMLFPSLKAMSNSYPFVRNRWWVLPFAWVYRWVVVFLFRQDTYKTQRARMNTLTVGNITAYQDELEFVGLDFNFTE